MTTINGRFQFGWVIEILTKNDQGIQIELANLGNGKHMIVATDISYPVSENVYRQSGFGPFILEVGWSMDESIKTLKEDLIKKRP